MRPMRAIAAPAATGEPGASPARKNAQKTNGDDAVAQGMGRVMIVADPADDEPDTGAEQHIGDEGGEQEGEIDDEVLREQVAAASSPQRVMEWARQRGMQMPEHVVILHLPAADGGSA